MPILHVNDIDLYYESHGSGAPLVLIAGLGYSHWMWHRMLPGLSRQFRVIVFDNRGVGQSDKPPGPYTAQLLADDTAALLEELGIQRAAVLGHSMGGYIAQALVLSRPELVGKLILSATNFGGPRQIPVTPEALAILMDVTGDPAERFERGILVSCAPGFAEAQPELLRTWLDYRLQNPIDPTAYSAQLAIGLGLLSAAASFEHRLPEVQVPTLILFGEHDKVVPPGNAGLLAAQLAQSTVRILTRAGHFYPLETAEAAVAAIAEFLQ